MPQTKPVHLLISQFNPSGLTVDGTPKLLGRSNPPYTIVVPSAASAGTFDILGSWDDAAGLVSFQPLAGKIRHGVGPTLSEWASLSGIVATSQALIVIEYPLTAIRANISAVTFASDTFRIVLIFDE